MTPASWLPLVTVVAVAVLAVRARPRAGARTIRSSPARRTRWWRRAERPLDEITVAEWCEHVADGRPCRPVADGRRARGGFADPVPVRRSRPAARPQLGRCARLVARRPLDPSRLGAARGPGLRRRRRRRGTATPARRGDTPCARRRASGAGDELRAGAPVGAGPHDRAVRGARPARRHGTIRP